MSRVNLAAGFMRTGEIEIGPDQRRAAQCGEDAAVWLPHTTLAEPTADSSAAFFSSQCCLNPTPNRTKHGSSAASVFYVAISSQSYPNRPAACASSVYTSPVSEVRWPRSACGPRSSRATSSSRRSNSVM